MPLDDCFSWIARFDDSSREVSDTECRCVLLYSIAMWVAHTESPKCLSSAFAVIRRLLAAFLCSCCWGCYICHPRDIVMHSVTLGDLVTLCTLEISCLFLEFILLPTKKNVSHNRLDQTRCHYCSRDCSFFIVFLLIVIKTYLSESFISLFHCCFSWISFSLIHSWFFGFTLFSILLKVLFSHLMNSFSSRSRSSISIVFLVEWKTQTTLLESKEIFHTLSSIPKQKEWLSRERSTEEGREKEK